MKFACAPNLRDLGGVELAGGRRLRRGQLYRAEAIRAPGDDDADRLAALGIRLVCDLRSARERAVAPSHWAVSGAQVLEMDIVADFRAHEDPLAPMRDDPSEAGAVKLMLATYDILPRACAPHLAELFARLARGEAPVLIHCTAGKDRTGFFSAMLLQALDAPREAIMADYMRTQDCPNPAVIAATREIMQAGLGRAADESAMRALTGVRPEYLDASYARMARDHGSADAYLREAVGLDEVRRRAIVAALTE